MPKEQTKVKAQTESKINKSKEDLDLNKKSQVEKENKDGVNKEAPLVYAIIQRGTFQYFAELGTELEMPELDMVVEGQEIEFKEVLLVVTEKETLIGDPLVKDAIIKAKVIGNYKTKKKYGFKYKSKSRYRRKYGYRSAKVLLFIESITAQGVNEKTDLKDYTFLERLEKKVVSQNFKLEQETSNEVMNIDNNKRDEANTKTKLKTVEKSVSKTKE